MQDADWTEEAHKNLLDGIVGLLKNREPEGQFLEIASALQNLRHVNILLLGPARSGKSTLIKAITGAEVQTGAGMDPVTLVMRPYQVGKLMFWDAPGFESWDDFHLFKWFHTNFSDSTAPTMAIFVLKDGNLGSRRLVTSTLVRLQQLKVLTVYVLSDIYCLGDEQRRNKELERQEITYEVLKTLNRPAEHKVITTTPLMEEYSESLLYALNVNSREKVVTLPSGPVVFPVCGIDKVRELLLSKMTPEQVLAVMTSCATNITWPRKTWNYMKTGFIETIRMAAPDVADKIIGGEGALVYNSLMQNFHGTWRDFVDSVRRTLLFLPSVA